MRKVALIMAGGTGGHVFPALAVAQALVAHGWQVVWLGTRGRLEERVVPAHNLPIHYLPVQGVRGHGIVRRALAPLMLLQSVWLAWRLMGQIRPSVVLGMGGYASGPGGLAAWLRRIPLIIHEQNAAAGLTNRMLSHLARRVLCAFSGPFPGQAEVMGNPLRADFVRVTGRNPRPWRLLVVGGSLGARFLNETLPAAVAMSSHPWQVVHQCGRNDVDTVRAAYAKAGLAARAEVRPFIEDMATAYRHAQLVVCRAGALTVSELAAVGVPSVLVPLPTAVDDHQTKNAMVLVDAGAAVLAPQAKTSVASLATLLDELGDAPARLESMAKAARRLDRPTATTDVVAVIEKEALGARRVNG